jgi:hypothetical protein
LSRPIIARLHSESRDSNGISLPLDHQRLLQQNRHKRESHAMFALSPLLEHERTQLEHRGSRTIPLSDRQLSWRVDSPRFQEL